MEMIVNFFAEYQIIRLTCELVIVILTDRILRFSISKLLPDGKIKVSAKRIITFVITVTVLVGMLYLDSSIASYATENNNKKLVESMNQIVSSNGKVTSDKIIEELKEFGIGDEIAKEIGLLYNVIAVKSIEIENLKMEKGELNNVVQDKTSLDNELEKYKGEITTLVLEKNELIDTLQILENELKNLQKSVPIIVNSSENTVFPISYLDGSDRVYSDFWNSATPFMIDGKAYSGNIKGIAIAGEEKMNSSYTYKMPRFNFYNDELKYSTLTFKAAIDDLYSKVDYDLGSGVMVIGISNELGTKLILNQELERNGKINEISVNVKGYQKVIIAIAPARSSFDSYRISFDDMELYDYQHSLSTSRKDYVLLFDTVMK